MCTLLSASFVESLTFPVFVEEALSPFIILDAILNHPDPLREVGGVDSSGRGPSAISLDF